MTDSKGTLEELDAVILTAMLGGADVLVDGRTRTFHSFNRNAGETFKRVRAEQHGGEDIVTFLRALRAAGLVLFGVTPDGGLYELNDPEVDGTESAPTGQ